ncbi:hypothetical protein [uncultured Halomonas sp.]|uniref:BapA/Bap/LapF family prefix-like domain-containing protein n=1 Tax=uncultured Halomonas sp. TaxID=173971 RepID=UPI00261FD5E0|nr:hypothetical protein [uncultured Halomonas sp.]
MSITVQVAGMRQSLETAEPQQVSDFIALTTPSKVLVDITPDEIAGLSREGTSLMVEQMGGGSLEVLGFFNGSGQSQLYLPSGDGPLLMASITTAPGSNSLSTIFVAATDEALRFDPDALLAEAEQASPSEAPAALDWWEDDEVAEEDVTAGSTAAEPEAVAMADGINIEEVFLAEEVPVREAAPAEEVMRGSTAAEGSWLDGIGPDLMGFLAFGAALGARAAHNQSSSSSSGRRSEDVEGDEEALDDGAQVAAADEELSQEEGEALLLQEDESMLVLDGDEETWEAAMAAAPMPEEITDMPEFASLSDAFGNADELAAAGPEVMA